MHASSDSRCILRMLRSATTVASAPLARLIVIGLLSGTGSHGQEVRSRPEFAIVSVKPTNLSLHQQIDMRALPNGGITATAVTLHFLIKSAYGLQDSQISGGPDWIRSEKYDIVAKPDEGAKPEILPMLQTLLADRFKLVVRSTTKESPTYELKLARSDGKYGPSLHELEAGDCPIANAIRGTAPCGGFLSGRNHLSGHRVKMSQLTAPLSSILERAVVDRTGLTSDFDLSLYWTPEVNTPGRGDAVPVPAGISSSSIFTAVKEQLGLKLEGAKGSVKVLVIERAERPGAN